MHIPHSEFPKPMNGKDPMDINKKEAKPTGNYMAAEYENLDKLHNIQVV
jgi:hypothetical protein